MNTNDYNPIPYPQEGKAEEALVGHFIDETPDVLEELEEEGIFTYPLSRPLLVDGVGVRELHVDFTTLTGKDAKRAEAYAKPKIGEQPEFTYAFQEFMLARAAGIPVGVVEELAAADYVYLTKRTLTFFVSYWER